jgi:hypothetical protein
MKDDVKPLPTREHLRWAEPIVFLFLGLLLVTLAVISPPIRRVAAMPQVAEKVGPRNKSEPWKKYEINSIPYAVALEWVMGNEIGNNSKRVLFVHLEPKYFNRENLLLVFGHISSKIPQPTTLNVTLLTDQDALQKRVRAYAGWMMSNETSFTRLTIKSDTCCPDQFKGAQFDRYADEGKVVICTNGTPYEITINYDAPRQN